MFSHWLLKITPRNISIAVNANTKEASHQFVGWNSCKYHLKIQLHLKIKYMTLWNVSKLLKLLLIIVEWKQKSCWGQNVWLYDIKANFMITPCIKQYWKLFHYQLMHTMLKNTESLKHSKITLQHVSVYVETIFRELQSVIG